MGNAEYPRGVHPGKNCSVKGCCGYAVIEGVRYEHCSGISMCEEACQKVYEKVPAEQQASFWRSARGWSRRSSPRAPTTAAAPSSPTVR